MGERSVVVVADVIVVFELSLVRFLFEVFLDPECWDVLNRCKIFAQQRIHHMARDRNI